MAGRDARVPGEIQAERKRFPADISQARMPGLPAASAQIVFTELRAARASDLITLIANGNVADKLVRGQSATHAGRFLLSIDLALPG
jgi:hypothetical protein